MKHTRWILLIFLLLVTGISSAAAQGLDLDNDGVPFRQDDCPGQAGPASNNGCPLTLVAPPGPEQTDTDGDGLPDSDDQCPTVPGTRENRGCPPPSDPPPSNPPTSNDPPPATPDTDGDGLPDPDDQCPTVPGPRENGGCPPPSDPPPSNPPNNVPDSSVPPFSPPGLPTDGCYVTSANGNQINVRKEPNMGAEVIGYLIPGVVYAAEGYVVNGPEIWYALTMYENSSGERGYTSSTVVVASACDLIDDGGPATVPPAQPDLTSDSAGGQPPLCHLSVGYDAATWSDDPVASPSVAYAAFWFAFEPGAPIPAGTPVWGVIFVDDFLLLPDSFLQLHDADNAIAVATDPAVLQTALDTDTGVYANWPTANGGIEAGGTRLYRLSGEAGGNCGPITNTPFNPADNFAQEDGGPIVDAMICHTKPGTTLVESCWCETSDSECVDQLVSICHGGSAYIDQGPDMTACWWDESVRDPGEHLTASARDPFDAAAINCGDISVWWIDIPGFHDAPTDLVGNGYCTDDLNDVLNSDVPAGTTRLITKRGGGNDGLTDPTLPTDCDENGIPDRDEFPRPGCADLTTLPDPGEDRKETVPWWTEVMNLTCPGGWVIVIDTDADGEEVVTDAQCDD